MGHPRFENTKKLIGKVDGFQGSNWEEFQEVCEVLERQDFFKREIQRAERLLQIILSNPIKPSTRDAKNVFLVFG